MKGQVLAADSAMDLYLVSAGRRDGVKAGDELTVYRGDEFVAVVVGDRVFEDRASVRVKRAGAKPVKKSGIRQRDRVASIF